MTLIRTSTEKPVDPNRPLGTKQWLCENNKHTPCRCNSIEEQRKADKENIVKFMNYTCETPVKTDRSPAGYVCTQIRGRRRLYVDVDNKPLKGLTHLDIIYNAGCELRCTDNNCDKLNKKRNAVIHG